MPEIYSSTGTSLTLPDDNPDLLNSYLNNGNWSVDKPGNSTSSATPSTSSATSTATMTPPATSPPPTSQPASPTADNTITPTLPTAYRTTQGDKVTNEGNGHLEVGGSEVDVPIHQGSSFAPVNVLEKITGQTATKDPQTGTISLGGKQFQPVGYDENGNPMLGVRNTLESLGGYNINWDQNTHDITVTKAPQQQQSSLPPYLSDIAQSMPQAPQIPAYQAPDLSGFQSQLLPYQQFNPDYNTYYDQAHAQLDPQYQGKYNDLMAKQNVDLQNQDEMMNRRGLFDSGIAVAAANDLRAKTTNSIANVFLQQQAAINKTAQQLYQNAFKEYQNGNQFALKNNQFIMNQMLAQEKQSFTQWLGTQKLSLQQYDYALRSWDNMANMIQKDAINQQNMAWKDYSFNNLSADQQANINKAYDQMSQNWQKAILPYEQMTQYQQGQLGQGQQKIDLQTAAQNAANYFKQLGYNLDVNKLQEAIRHDQAGEANSAASLQERIKTDQANLAKVNVQNMTAAKRLQFDALNAQLSDLNKQMDNYVTNNKPVPQSMADDYEKIRTKINDIVQPTEPQQMYGPPDLSGTGG